MRTAWTITAVGLVAAGMGWAAAPATRPAVPIYGDAADALPNRLHSALFARVDRAGRDVGLDEVDPLLWYDTKHLSTGQSNAAAIKLLDDLAAHPPTDVGSPLARAVLQHDLWSVFDWAAEPIPVNDGDTRPAETAGRKLLCQKLAAAMRHVALTANEATALPDNYKAAVAAKAFAAKFDPDKPDAPFLPADLLDPAGPWVCVGTPRAEGVAATDHARFFGGRSAFLVFVNLPGGRTATVEYLEKLSAVPVRTVRSRPPSNSVSLVEGLPQFPAGTQVALVRRMMVVDAAGRVTPTGVVQSVQVRAFVRVRPGSNQLPDDQRFLEFTLDRRSLLAGGGGLRLVGADEEAQIGFNGIFGNADPYESAEPSRHRPHTVMSTCAACHSPSGIYSVNTFSNGNADAKPDPHLLPVTIEAEAKRAAELKSARADLAALRETFGNRREP